MRRLSSRTGRCLLRRLRPRFVLSGLSPREIPGALVRFAKGGPGLDPGREAKEDKIPPSRAEAVLGAVVYALLIPGGIWILEGRSVLAALPGILLVAIGVAGVLGLLVRNLGPKAGRRP